MRFFGLICLLFFTSLCHGQLNVPCNNWLKTPTEPAYVDIGHLNVTGNKITVEALINRTVPYAVGIGNGNEGDVVSKHDSPGDVNYLLRPNHGYVTTTNGFFATPDVCEIEINKVYHIAMVYDGSTLKYYRNGFLMSQVAASGDLFQNGWPTRIGRYSGSVLSSFLGFTNEVRIWNVARTQAQIKANMNSSLPSPATQTGLLAYYTFDNLLNKQGNGAWNGSLGGTATINSTTSNCNFFIDSCFTRVNVSNIINDYTPALSLEVCKNLLTVEDAAAFKAGDTVLLIQMKGAVIDSTNTSAFGNITNYKNAGNYEFNYVKSKTGNVIELKNILTKQYDLPAGRVQLIRVPYYQNVNISSTLTCLPWDGKKGGVLAFNVQDTINLSADINTSGKGFRGGNSPNPASPVLRCAQNEYSYPLNDNNAAAKGESIYNIGNPNAWGKGAPANGGGGGNGHNSGGGGGGNGGVGGFGGFQLLTCGNAPFDNRGVGGRPLTYTNVSNKIFMGGGGGSGHTDNPNGSNMEGGNGGGIIIIRATNIKANGFKIISNGNNATQCTFATFSDCHDGSGGGGAGGTILIENNTFLSPLSADAKGGKGGDLIIYNPGIGADKIGPGGGGGGGVVWLNKNNTPPNLVSDYSSGFNGSIIQNSNDPWGATPGQPGVAMYDLVIPVATAPFKTNIDSVRINSNATGCHTFDFAGIAYTNTNPINTWQWDFGDGNTANTQNTTHTYATKGVYKVKLLVTDINGCRDSVIKNITGVSLNSEIIFAYVPCLRETTIILRDGEINPLVPPGNWDFGDGNSATGVILALHTYPSSGIYTIKHSRSYLGCTDTSVMILDASIIPENIISTNDTTICSGTTKQLIGQSSDKFCWSPPLYLNDPFISNPVTSTPETIKYYYTAEIASGINLIPNNDFSAGNTGFTSDYVFQTNNINTSGAYGIANNSQGWNSSASSCTDHTSGSGKMFVANGATLAGQKAWEVTIPVTAGTNYQFSGWIQSISAGSLSTTAGLRIYINNNRTTFSINAPINNCQWEEVRFNWNSGNNTLVNISLINDNISGTGNDFALDDIYFGQVFLKRDSVTITVDTAVIVATNNSSICEGTSIQLNAIGTGTFAWSPAGSLDDPAIANPLATPTGSTRYIVTGTSNNGCVAKDSVDITVNPKPLITKSADAEICINNSTRLSASGGVSYSWLPAGSLDNASSPTPLATPLVSTTYIVTVTGTNTCKNTDSIKIGVRNPDVFTITPPVDICKKDSVQLNVIGGDTYAWQPAGSLSDPTIANPLASPGNNTTYSVLITDTFCGFSKTLSTAVTVLPLPIVRASRSNDIDCSSNQSQLIATGALDFSWSPAATLTKPNTATPIARPLATTKYIVSGTASWGCTNYDSVMVNVSLTENGNYLMPTAFTPNNDGKNDCYGIKYWGTIQEIDFSIYNRWGERIFHTNTIGQCWDGNYRGQAQGTNVFVYVIKAKTTCQPEVFRTGTFTLIR